MKYISPCCAFLISRLQITFVAAFIFMYLHASAYVYVYVCLRDSSNLETIGDRVNEFDRFNVLQSTSQPVVDIHRYQRNFYVIPVGFLLKCYRAIQINNHTEGASRLCVFAFCGLDQPLTEILKEHCAVMYV